MQIHIFQFLPITIIATLFCCGVQTETYNSGLYSLDDDVEILTGSTLNAHFYHKKHAWVVKYYMSWCGHCQSVAPQWKMFGTDVRNWSPLVKVAAMDCSQEENSEICNEQGIFAVPLVRYYHENTEPGNLGFNLPTIDMHNFTNIRHNLVYMLQIEQVQKRFEHAPNLLPYQGDNLQGLWSPENVQPFIFVILEDGWDKMGSEVIMDLHYAKNIVIKRVVPELELFNVTDLPSLLIVAKNLQVTNITPVYKTRETFRKTIVGYAEAKGIKIMAPAPPVFNEHLREGPKGGETPKDTPKGQIDFDELKNILDKLGDPVFQADFENTIHYSLTHEIIAQQSISGMHKSTLTRFVDLLIKYIPVSENAKKFLTELKDHVSKKFTISGLELRTLLRELKQKYDPVFEQPLQWIACRGSVSSKRGYPCGLWKLFHYATVQAIKALRYPNYEVLPVMHDYIKYFFACSYCSQHFQEMAKQRKLRDVIEGSQAALWLWSAHNEVNKRLAGDESEDPAFPKVEFPTAQHCPTCRMADGNWNNTEVLKYLKVAYSEENVQKTLPLDLQKVLTTNVVVTNDSDSKLE